jgi:hypothetical protein
MEVYNQRSEDPQVSNDKKINDNERIDKTLYGLFVFLNAIVVLLIILIFISFWINYSSLAKALTTIASFLSISGAY